MIDIFGSNLLNEESQIEGYKELCGLKLHKPFECVGEIEESVLLMQILRRSERWTNDLVPRQLGPMLKSNEQDFSNAYASIYMTRYDHSLPGRFREILSV